MAVGLGADAAVAALQIGEVERALSAFADALIELRRIDPESSLQATHCHKVIRHAVLWAQAYIGKRNVIVDGASILIEPGCCSKPDPLVAISQYPLGNIDICWYMLAESEVTSGNNVGIADKLYDRLGGPIPTMEFDLRISRVKRDITDLNAEGFALHLWSHVEAMAHLSHLGREIQASFDILNPSRGDIPRVPHSNLSISLISDIVNDAVMAYAIVAACNHSAEAISDLWVALKTEFGRDIPGAGLLARATAQIPLPSALTFDEALIDSVKWFSNATQPDPQAYCVAAIRFFQQARYSSFKNYLVRIIAGWQRIAWSRIVVSETFRLLMPSRTVPEINDALAMPDEDERFLGALLLAAASATGVMLPHEMQKALGTLAAMRRDE